MSIENKQKLEGLYRTVITLLVGACAWFLSHMSGEFDDAKKAIQDLEKKVAGMEASISIILNQTK